MAVPQSGLFRVCKCPADYFPRDYKAALLSASITLEYFKLVFFLANQTAAVITF